MRTLSSPRLRTLLSLSALVAGATAGCHKGTELEPGAVMLDLSVMGGVSTPDELRLFVYDDTGALWRNRRVPDTGALAPESPTHLGTVLIQPGTTTGPLRVQVIGMVSAARVAEGVITIPAPPQGQFSLQLDGAAAADDDGDGVPNAIDDCPATSNPSQGGCPGTDDGGMDAAPDDGGMDASPPDTGMDAPSCEASGACDRPNGAACMDGGQCHSSFCVDGVCCMNACLGPCRSCNQPNNDGTCLPYPQATDPAFECSGGMTCNGVGACGPVPGGPKTNGNLCGDATECMSGFCKDGVCCNTACDTPCKTCETGTCQTVTRKPDPPECYGNVSCNPAGKCG